MNCRPLTVALLFGVGLVPSLQAAFAADPTSRQVTATAAILDVTMNDKPSVEQGQKVTKFIDATGRITAIRTSGSRMLVIIDMP
jgi:hypothetical protein